MSGGISTATIEALEYGLVLVGGVAAASTIGVGVGVAFAAVSVAYGGGYTIGLMLNLLK